jgi:mRNA interferase HicA
LLILATSITEQGEAVKQQEFVRWLEEQDVKIVNGKGHLKAFYGGKQTTVPRHPGKEIDNQFAKIIAKQLGLEMKL